MGFDPLPPQGGPPRVLVISLSLVGCHTGGLVPNHIPASSTLLNVASTLSLAMEDLFCWSSGLLQDELHYVALWYVCERR